MNPFGETCERSRWKRRASAYTFALEPQEHQQRPSGRCEGEMRLFQHGLRILRRHRRARRARRPFGADSDNRELQILNLYPEATFQEFKGFGGAFTESAGYVFSRLPAARQEELLRAYFGQGEPRLHAGARLRWTAAIFHWNRTAPPPPPPPPPVTDPEDRAL